MIEANEIIKNLVVDMEETIDPSNGYASKPNIKKGVYTWNKADCPMVGLHVIGAGVEELMGEKVRGHLRILVYGHVEADNDDYNNDETLFNVIYDTVKYFTTDCVYINNIDEMTDVETANGMTSKERTILSFQFEVLLSYESTRTELTE